MPTHTKQGLFIRTKLALAIGACGLFCATPAVFAQDDAEEKTDKEVEEVVIVGSLLRQTSLKTISPTKLFLRETATDAGLSTTTDLLQGNGVTGGTEQINNAYAGFTTDGGPGANTISLRGLGATRTLVLINGRRLAPSGTRGAVGSADLNVLPSGIIDRVEILRDGASSIYGSDAISGVINVVTKNDWDGVTLEGEFNDPTEGGGEQARFSLSGGMKEENFQLSGSFDFYERKNLTLADRDWTRCNMHMLRDPTTGASLDFIDPETGKSKCYPITGTGSNGLTINTIGLQEINSTNYASLGLTSPVVGAPGSTGTRFDRFRPNASITTGLVGFEGVGGFTNNTNVRDTFDEDMLKRSLISPVKNYVGFLEGRYDLGDAEVYAEMLASKRQSSQTVYRQLTLDYRRGSPLIPSSLAFGNFSAAQPTTEGTRVGVRAFIGFGADPSSQEVDFYKPTIGIRGDLTFLPEWNYDAYFSYSKSKATYQSPAFLIDKLTYASNAVTATSNVDSSLVRDGLTCNINLTRPGEKCIPYPQLTAETIGGSLPQDFRDYIFQNTEGETKFYESVHSLILNGPLLTLAAGDVQAAVGLEHRRSQINDIPDENSIRGNVDGASAVITAGKDNVSEIYTEIEVPILSDQPFAEKLSVNTSLRYTNYDSYGSDETYKLGFIYAPNDWISFRASQGTSFRAPALFEQFQGAASSFSSSANDPCNNYGVHPNEFRVANCNSEGLPPGFSASSSIQVLSQGGAETGLIAETSKNFTYGIILDPEISDSTNMVLTVDYFDIEISNGVDKAGVTQILPRCYDDRDFQTDGGYCRLVSRDPVSNRLTVNNAYTNISTDISRGIDVDMTFDQELPLGTFLTDITLTRYYAQEQKLFEGDPLKELNGSLNKPKYGATANIGYKLANWKLSYGVEWISSMSGYKEVNENPETSIRDLEVPSYFEHRISLRYQADNWKTTSGVRNLTNETPPEISATSSIFQRVGNSPLYSGYDYAGRELFVNFQINL
jgi:iron complex outermembrane receptor protein